MRALLLACLLLPLAAPAAIADEVAEAKAHYARGAAYYEKGLWGAAVEEFEKSYALSHRPAILFNIARAEEQLGHEQASLRYLRRYLAEAPDVEDAAAVRAEIAARERALAEGRSRPRPDLATGRKPAADEKKPAADEKKPAADEKKPAAARGETGGSGPLPRWPAYLALGAGGAMLLAGVACGGAAAVKASNLSSPAAGQQWGPAQADEEARARALGQAGVALDVLGLLAAGAGGFWWWWSSRAGRSPPRAWLAPGSGGLAVGGQF